MPDNNTSNRQQHNFSSGSRPIEGPTGLMPPIGAMSGLDIWVPFVSNIQAWTRQMAQFNTTLQHEWMSFIERRLKQDATLTQQLADCKGTDDIMRTYSEFMRTAFDDYQQEFSAFAKLGGALTSDALGALQVEQDASASDRVVRRAPTTGLRTRQGSPVGTEH